MHKRFFTLLLLFLLFFGLTTCTNNLNLETTNSPPNQETSQVKIWWAQGFIPEENDIIIQLVSQWETESGEKAELILLPDRDILQDTQKALDDGKGPDILFSFAGDTNLFPILAWKNQLADVSELLNPIKFIYNPVALQSVYYQNKVDRKRSYYAVPLAQQTVHIFYWRNLIAEAGFNEAEIPRQWDEFWNFWGKVQNNLRQKGQKNIYALGLTMSPFGTDTFWAFEQFLNAYNVKIVDENGQLLLDGPNSRQEIITALKQFTSFYKDGYVPPRAVEWTDSGNNNSFLTGQSLMTANSTLSIPLTQKQERNEYNQLSTDLYLNKIVTTEWPRKPNGEVLTSVLSIKQAVIFENSKNKKAATSFLSYLLRPENLNRFLKDANKGRIFPVMPKLLEDSFWKDPTDPHLSAALKQYQKLMHPCSQVFNPAYSQVFSQNIWAKAILSVIKNGVSPEQAADNAIGQIKQIFSEWK